MSTVAPGQTFGPPDALNSDAATDALRDDTFARVVSDGGDTFIAVWDSCGGPGTDCSTATPFGKDRDIFFSWSTTGGVTWEPQQPLKSDAVDPKPTDSGPQDARPAIATDGSMWAAVWRRQDPVGGDDDIEFATLSPPAADWTMAALDPSDTGKANGNANAPEIATDGSGRWLAVWVDGSRDILAALGTSSGGGIDWSPPQPLNKDVPSDTQSRFPHVATDGRLWVVVWSGTNCERIGTDRDICAVTSTDGVGWSAVRTANSYAADDKLDDWDPRVATDQEGRWMVVWSRQTTSGGCDAESGLDIAFAISNDPSNGWSPAGSVFTDDATQDEYPRVISDGPGAWVVIRETAGLFGSDDDIAITRSDDNGKNWLPPVPVNGSRAKGNLFADEHPDLARNADGRWVAAWQSDDKLGGKLYSSTSDNDVLFAMGEELPVTTTSSMSTSTTSSTTTSTTSTTTSTTTTTSSTSTTTTSTTTSTTHQPTTTTTSTTTSTTQQPTTTSSTSTTTSTSNAITSTTSSSSTTTSVPPAECGNGTTEQGEECDLGPANGTVGVCCTAACTYRAAGDACRPAVARCDIAERCSGDAATCPSAACAPATTVCRPKAGECDRAETCTGTSASCPPDELMPAGATCRAAQDACDEAEVCDGTTASCPPDARKPPNASCDDNDPETTSSCQGDRCVGVKTTVVVPPPLPVPPTLPPSQVKIAVDVTVPDTTGTTAAKVTLQGTVDCDAIPLALQPKKCRQSGGTAGNGARLDTVTVRVP